MQKLAFIHLDKNLQKERAIANNTQQTSITTLAAPTHRRWDVDRSEKIKQLISEMTASDLKGKGFCKLMQSVDPEYQVAQRLRFDLSLASRFLMCAILCAKLSF